MIDAYLDESGIHDGAVICTIAGYLGGRGQFRKLATAWCEHLANFEVPMEKFHAKDLIPKPQGFFFGWERERYDLFIDGLIKVITKYKLHPVSASVVVSDFYSLSEMQRRFFTGATLDDGKLIGSGSPNKPYWIAFHDCIQTVACYAPVGGKAHYFFGLNRPFAEYAEVLFRDIKDNWTTTLCRERLGAIGFPLAKETAPLQAADFLVHLDYHHAIKHHAAGTLGASQPDGLLLKCLERSRSSRDDHSFYNRAGFQKALDHTYESYPNWDMQSSS